MAEAIAPVIPSVVEGPRASTLDSATGSLDYARDDGYKGASTLS
jgi:hypothetical protein